MIQTVEGVIDSQGKVRLPVDVHLPAGRRAFVTVLDEPADTEISETAILGEASLAEDWLRDEEDEAWLHLQTEQ